MAPLRSFGSVFVIRQKTEKETYTIKGEQTLLWLRVCCLAQRLITVLEISTASLSSTLTTKETVHSVLAHFLHTMVFLPKWFSLPSKIKCSPCKMEILERKTTDLLLLNISIRHNKPVWPPFHVHHILKKALHSSEPCPLCWLGNKWWSIINRRLLRCITMTHWSCDGIVVSVSYGPLYIL